MKPETKKYLRKRNQVMVIIQSVPVTFRSRSFDDEGNKYLFDDHVNINQWDAREMAERILSSFGINKPQELSSMESKSCIITGQKE